ncbi:ATP-dependent permease PDR12 [Fusarium oxysporum f. sp. albedinis]|nr:ATP-dependent permease PDR12 [Fusarium oxysporum f. sp. albedinis]
MRTYPLPRFGRFALGGNWGLDLNSALISGVQWCVTTWQLSFFSPIPSLVLFCLGNLSDGQSDKPRYPSVPSLFSSFWIVLRVGVAFLRLATSGP